MRTDTENIQAINLSGVLISDYSIKIDQQKANLWNLSTGMIKANDQWFEKSDRANPRIRPEMTSAYVVKTRVRLPNKTREQFLQDLKEEYMNHPTWKGEDIYYQMLAEGKIPKINGRTMAPRTFLEHYRVVRDSGDLVKNLSDAIMAMWFSGEKRAAYISKRLACSRTKVYEIFKEHGVNVKPYKVKGKES